MDKKDDKFTDRALLAMLFVVTFMIGMAIGGLITHLWGG
jgi:hypothetical protein